MVNRSALRILAGAIIGAVILGGCSGQVDKSGGAQATAPLVLTGINTRSALEVQPFVDEVTMLSKGALEVAFESGWHKDSTTSEAEAIDAVRAGSADFAVVPVRAWHDAGVTSFDTLIAPMVVDSYALQDAVLQDGVATEMLAGVEALGLTGIGILPGPMRKPAGIARDFLVPDDFQGAQIGISAGAVADRSLRELGATPVPTPFERKDVSQFDGVELQVDAIAGNEYDGVVTSVTMNVNLWPRPYVIVGNTKALEALSADQLALLTDAARRAIPPTSLAQQHTETDSTDVLCRRARLAFLAATDGQLQQLRDAFGPVNDWLAEDEQTRGFLQRIQELRPDVTAVSNSLSDCGTSPGAGTGESTPIDGVYTMTTTWADAVAFGIPDDGNQVSVGTYTWTFNRGHYSETQRNGQTRTEGSGTYVIDGDTLTMTVEEGSGSGPSADNSPHPGDVATWKWSLYRDQLTIHWPDPTLSPTDYPANYAVKPWTRTGDAPESSAPTGEVSALEGRWTVSYTRDEYVAAGADAEERRLSENWGGFSIEFAAGLFSMSNTAEGGSIAGSYAVDGDLLTLNVETTSELFTLGWSVYRDALTFQRVAGAVSPTGFVVKPWTRVGS